MKRLIGNCVMFLLCSFISVLGNAQTPQSTNLVTNNNRGFVLNENSKKEIIEAVVSALKANYVFPEVADKMAVAIREKSSSGGYDKIALPQQFADTLRADLYEICKDGHLRMNYSPSKQPPMRPRSEPSPEDKERMKALMAKDNFSFVKTEILDGNVGYLDFRGFLPPDFAGESLAAAMNYLNNTDALIIDMRRNGGGDPAMVALVCSYFFDKKTHLNDIYDRPTDLTKEFWTHDSLPGKRYINKPVYILTAKRTFSAAEDFAYTMKTLKRAIIVGEVTGGGAHPTSFFRIHDHFGMGIPMARSINPITKTNWEGTGVKPDNETSSDASLKVAHKAAIQELVSKAHDAEWKRNLEDTLSGFNADEKPLPVYDGNVEIPKSPAGDAMRKFIAGINSGDVGHMRRFHQSQNGFPPNGSADFDRLYKPSDGLIVRKVVSSSDNQIEIVVQFKNNKGWRKINMEVEAAPPHNLKGIKFNETEPLEIK